MTEADIDHALLPVHDLLARLRDERNHAGAMYAAMRVEELGAAVNQLRDELARG